MLNGISHTLLCTVNADRTLLIFYFSKVEFQSDRSIGEKKPKLSGGDRPSVMELSGYNSKREEFEIEYDNDAEQVLADMEFKETDTESERLLKLQVLQIYSKR